MNKLIVIASLFATTNAFVSPSAIKTALAKANAEVERLEAELEEASVDPAPEEGNTSEPEAPVPTSEDLVDEMTNAAIVAAEDLRDEGRTEQEPEATEVKTSDNEPEEAAAKLVIQDGEMFLQVKKGA